MTWHVVARLEEVQQGRVRTASVGDTVLALYNLDGTYFATSDICTHAVAFLSDGYLDGDCIECPLHAALFHIPTGEPRSGPADDPIKTYAVRTEGDSLLVEIDD